MHAELRHFLDAQHLDRQAQGLEALDPVGIGLRVQNVSGLGDEVAGEQHAVAYGLQRREGGLGGGDIVGDHGDRLERRRLFLLGRAEVFVEAVAGEMQGEYALGDDGGVIAAQVDAYALDAQSLDRVKEAGHHRLHGGGVQVGRRTATGNRIGSESCVRRRRDHLKPGLGALEAEG